MAFETFDFSKVVQVAQALDASKRQATMDKLQMQYLGNREAREATQAQQQTTQFDQGQQVANTEMLNAAAAELMQDPSEGAVMRWLPQLQQAGVIAPGHQPDVSNPEAIRARAQEIFASTSKSLQALGKRPGEVSASQVGGFNVLQQDGKVIEAVVPEKEKTPAITPYQQQQIDLDKQRLELDRQKADPAYRNKPANTQPLRKEFRNLPSVKAYEEVLPLVKSAANAPDNGYGDLQLIYTVGKALDPGSVVREGELALTIAAGSPLQRILGTTRFNFEKGGRIPPQQRKQIIGMLDERVNGYRQAYDRDYNQYSEYAQENGFEPSSIVGSKADTAYGAPKPSTPTKTATGPNGQKIGLVNGQWVPLNGQ